MYIIIWNTTNPASSLHSRHFLNNVPCILSYFPCHYICTLIETSLIFLSERKTEVYWNVKIGPRFTRRTVLGSVHIWCSLGTNVNTPSNFK